MTQKFFVDCFIYFGDTAPEFSDNEGLGIAFVSARDFASPVYQQLNASIGDGTITKKATSYVDTLRSSGDSIKMLSYLWGDPVLQVERVNIAIVLDPPTFELLTLRPNDDPATWQDIDTPWSTWLNAQSRLIVEIAKLTTAGDTLLQHWLNYLDFILEMARTETGKRCIAELYDLRGLDFFLFHYMGGETSAKSDNALFDSAALVIDVLKAIGRSEEAALVTQELDDRKQGIAQIISEFQGTQNDNSYKESLERVRLWAERRLVTVLGDHVWQKLHTESRSDLLEATIQQVMLEKRVLRGWNSVVLLLCKVVERELWIVLFGQWIELIRASTFACDGFLTNKQAKCRTTYDILMRCANGQNQGPTLGQLIQIADFTCDETMDRCTSLFIQMRSELSLFQPDVLAILIQLNQLLHTPYQSVGVEVSLRDIRNASAHPNRDNLYTWADCADWLTRLLISPASGLNLIVKLRKSP